jgi:hypothetical protein
MNENNIMKLFFILIFFISSHSIIAQKENVKNINLIDTIAPISPPSERKGDKSAFYRPLYVGQVKTPIKLDYNLLPFKGSYFVLKRDRTMSSLDNAILPIAIIVDTSRTIAYVELSSQKIVSAFPVFIINKGLKPVYISENLQIDLILQAQNKNGEWFDIETRFIQDCQNDMMYLKLEPKHLVVTHHIIQNGTIHSKLRLRLGGQFSNVFNGFIFELK